MAQELRKYNCCVEKLTELKADIAFILRNRMTVKMFESEEAR